MVKCPRDKVSVIKCPVIKWPVIKCPVTDFLRGDNHERDLEGEFDQTVEEIKEDVTHFLHRSGNSFYRWDLQKTLFVVLLSITKW